MPHSVGNQQDLSAPNIVRSLKPTAQRDPDPEVADRPASRRFSAEYKAQILERAAQCRHGEIGALLRREGLYSSVLSKWRRQQQQAVAKALALQRPGPKPTEPNPLAAQLMQSERENARLRRQLKQAEGIIELQKKISEILSISLNPPESDKLD